MNARTYQIIAAMKGRQASAVNDTKLRDAVRFKVEDLAKIQGVPITSTDALAIATRICQAAGRTIIFEDEVLVAMEMGAAGEFTGTPSKIGRNSCVSWITCYAASGDRRAAQEQISLDAARDRKRADEVCRDQQRRDYESDGLRRAWHTFIASGWDFSAGYAAAIYTQVGPSSIRAIVPQERIASTREEAIDQVRHASRLAEKGGGMMRYSTAPTVDIEQAPVFMMYWKALLLRAYFEILQSTGREPVQPSAV